MSRTPPGRWKSVDAAAHALGVDLDAVVVPELVADVSLHEPLDVAPAKLRRLLRLARGGQDSDTSGANFRIVKVCQENGLTPGQTFTFMRKHLDSSQYKGFGDGWLAQDIGRIWALPGKKGSGKKASDSTPTGSYEGDELGDGSLFTAVSMADVQETKVKWIWYGWLPLGKIVTMDGDPGVAKSTLALTIAAHITRGREWPDGSPCPEGAVIIMSAEDDLDDTVKPRLRLAGAKMDRVHALEEVRDEDGPMRLPNLGDVKQLRALIKKTGAKLVVVDVFMSYVPTKSDSHKDQDVRGFLYPLKRLASETGCSFLMLRHLNKSGGTNAKHRGGGSVGITGASRAVWTVGEDKVQPGVRVLSSAKVNNAPKPGSLEYTLDFDAESETGVIRWIGESALSADDLVTEHSAKDSAPRRSEAETALMGLLTDAGGSMPSAELAEAMEAAGFNASTTHRAKKALGVTSKKDPAMDGRWTSYLPNISTS